MKKLSLSEWMKCSSKTIGGPCVKETHIQWKTFVAKLWQNNTCHLNHRSQHILWTCQANTAQCNYNMLTFSFFSGVYSGPHERRLINDLLEKYNDLERPVFNESDALTLKFGLTLQQIIDVVSSRLTHANCKSTEWIDFWNWMETALSINYFRSFLKRKSKYLQCLFLRCIHSRLIPVLHSVKC